MAQLLSGYLLSTGLFDFCLLTTKDLLLFSLPRHSRQRPLMKSNMKKERKTVLY